ncbi:hypothetical protein CANARDRAFT_97726 [[Candida] arabinofermentans NRRL YB-2248]|uniref:Activator of Hsp90 ATPase AHSA1-like N-terminal domain-containing protein n=1 Tax=[Candida] arabinofermentans NRRL YB-2248 TaxID=983967 RepID=A0A1E4T718_9ASCO|nr:hypothetical protein CANARDRAFT_97726 [[Candida] arabinofermentans NRRL YB-2248]
MSIVHNPNNWHWIDKNCLPWANTYLEKNLLNLSASKDDFEMVVSSIKPLTGDCDVTQRKGKIRCIFELNLEFNIKLINKELDKDQEDIIYDVKLLEFEHDQDESDYQFDIKNGRIEYKKLIRDTLIPEVLKVLLKFQPDLLEAQQPSLQHNTN